jgi:hypothetical protein
MGSLQVMMAPVVSLSEFFSQPIASTLSNRPEATWYWAAMDTEAPVVPPVEIFMIGFITPPEPSTLQVSAKLTDSKWSMLPMTMASMSRMVSSQSSRARVTASWIISRPVTSGRWLRWWVCPVPMMATRCATVFPS